MFLFGDGFGHLTAAQLAAKWTDVAGGTLGAYGRGGVPGILLASGEWLRATLAPSDNTFGIAFPFRVTSPFVSSAMLVVVYDVGTEQFRLQVNGDGTLSVVGPSGIVGTSTAALHVNVYAALELKAVVANAGSVEVRIDGDPVLVLTGVDLQATANASWNSFGLFGAGLPANREIENVVVYDASGSEVNDFVGDIAAETRLPSGNGATSGFTGSDGNQVDNYLLVDDATPDDDTTHVQAADVGTTDTYPRAALVGTGTIIAVQHSIYARKTSTDVKALTSVCRAAGTDYPHASPATLGQTYACRRFVRTLNPNGGVPFTPATVDAMEWGLKVTT